MTVVLVLAGVAACCAIYPRSPTFNPSVPLSPVKFQNDALVERILLFLAGILAIVPRTRFVLLHLLVKLKNPSPLASRRIALAILVLSGPALYFSAVYRGQILLPQWHDENQYRLQSTMLAHGKLCMPPLPLPDFFDAPYVLTRPKYTGMYFPGTALLHVPGVWFHLPYSAVPLAIAAVTLALFYLIVRELLDGVAGLLAVLMLASLELFRWMAVVEMSHAAGAMWGLAAMSAWLAWRKSHAGRWIALAGVAAGWYAITRPLDAVCVLLPIALAWAWDLRRSPARTKLIAPAIVILTAAPFISLQLAFDRAVTGHFLQTPLSIYYRTYLNLHGVGLETYDPAFVPPTPSMLVVDTYRWFVAARVREFRTFRQAAAQWFTYRLPLSFGVGLPTLLLVVLYPVGLLQLNDLRRAVFWSMFWLFLLGTAPFFQYFTQYVMALAPALIFSILLGAAAVSRACARWKGVEIFLATAIFALALHRVFAGTNFYVQRPGMTVERANYFLIPSRVRRPAIVLFRYASDEPDNVLDEPVYNWDVCWPDDAPIIRAHDLGSARNRELFAYYARIQPGRTVYLYDRKRRTLLELGNVRRLLD
ncbi:MAG TPA: hypothetical protein VG326_04175 [Tepidisphaeraceae bacterium]|nr:hypothetical protein [Tepidisphaeraceae bacterium]